MLTALIIIAALSGTALGMAIYAVIQVNKLKVQQDDDVSAS